MTPLAARDVEAAKRLLAHESTNADGELTPASAAGRVHARLADRLTPLIGNAGYRALVARSVKLVSKEFPCFDGFVAGAPSIDDAPGEHLQACLSELEASAASAAAVALYGTLLGLLTGFIGEQLVRRVLPSAFAAIDDVGTKETER